MNNPPGLTRDMYHTRSLIIQLALAIDVTRASARNKTAVRREGISPRLCPKTESNRTSASTMPAPPRGEFNNITLTRNPDYFFTQREVVPLRKMTTPLSLQQQGGLRTLGGVPDTKLPLAKTTTSARKLTDYMKLNVRATIEPCDKYSEPMTSNMAYGWGFRIPQ